MKKSRRMETTKSPYVSAANSLDAWKCVALSLVTTVLIAEVFCCVVFKKKICWADEQKGHNHSWTGQNVCPRDYRLVFSQHFPIADTQHTPDITLRTRFGFLKVRLAVASESRHALL